MGRLLQADQLDALTTNAPEHKPIGRSALHMLANRPDPPGQRGELAQLLLEKNANPMRLTPSRQTTPLHMAAETCNVAVAEVLLRHDDVHVNAINKDNQVPLDCASNMQMQNLLEAEGGRPWRNQQVADGSR